MADAQTPNKTAPVYASFWHRTAALIIDLVVLYFLCEAVIIIWLHLGFDSDVLDLYLLEEHFPFYCTYDQLPIIKDWQVGFTCAVSYMAVSFFYFVLFHSSTLHATPGKKLLRLSIVTTHGTRVPVWRSGLRFFCAGMSVLPLLFGFFLTFFTPEKRALHDYFAGTVVIRTPPKPRT